MRLLSLGAPLLLSGCAQLLGLDHNPPLREGATCGESVGNDWSCGPGLECDAFSQTCQPIGDCVPDKVESCYSGPAGTEGVGACAAGSRTCASDGTWGSCLGEVVPALETCLTPGDDDCDGDVNEEGDGCVCVPDVQGPCYSGPLGTAGVGLCGAGAGLCNAAGTGTVGACAGEVLPATETCTNTTDEDCDGYGCSATRWARLLEVAVWTVAGDGAGGLFVAGSFNAPTDFGDGNQLVPSATDGFVARYDASGALLFVRPFAGVSVRALASLPGGVALGGTYVGNANLGCGALPSAALTRGLVAALDEAGGCTWSEGLGGTGQHQVTAVVVPAGSASVVAFGSAANGTVELDLPYTADAGDVFFGRFDGATGALTASFFSATPQAQSTGAAAADPNGNYAFLVSSPAGLTLPGGLTIGDPGSLAVRVGTNDAVSWIGSPGTAASAIAMGPLGEVYLSDWHLPGTFLIAGSQLVVPPGGAGVWAIRYTGPSGMFGTPSFPFLLGSGGDLRVPALTMGEGGRLFMGAQGNGTLDFGLGPLGPTQSYDVFFLGLSVSAGSMPVQTPAWNRLLGGPSLDAQVRLSATSDGGLAFAFGSGADPDVGTGPLVGQGVVFGVVGQ